MSARRRGARAMGSALVLAALAAGCGGGAAPATHGAGAAKTAGAVDTAAIDVRPASLAQVRGVLRTPQRGERVVVMNVWATWCAPCREEFPEFVRIRREYADRGVRLVLVSADVGAELPAVKRFLAAQGVDFPTLIKNESDMTFIDGIEPRWTGALPATFLYDAGDGHELWFHEGKVAYDTLKTRLDAALAAPPATRGGHP